ncbi:MAG TPA: hypothetical protein PKK06_00100 [Phycisphaerae bacterium]|nr:hypothetical protein [Phycisphaerae bacterium]HNU43988.1 hypothetical protein [Phycisphaerae bacterium]
MLLRHAMPRTIQALIVAAVALHSEGWTPAAAQTPTPEPANEEAPAVSPRPVLPEVRLSTPVGFSDEAAYDRAVEAKIKELVAAAGAATDALTAAEARLAAANLILARRTERDCSLVLLGLGRADGAGEALQPVFAQVTALLGEAGTAIARQRDAQSGDAAPELEGRLAAAERQREVLAAFAQALEAMVAADLRQDADGSRRRRAASGLAPLLEQAEPGVSSAALLYSAVLRADEDRDRVLTLLDLPLKTPASKDLPYALYTRLLRCRLLAEGGGHAAALALLFQLEEHCPNWLSDAAAGADAVRTVALGQLQMLADWHSRLSKPDQEDARRWCRSRFDALSDEHFPGGSGTVLRLGRAVPTLVAAAEEVASAAGSVQLDAGGQ